MPKVIKAGSDGVYDLSWPKQSGKEAVDGLVLLAGLAGAGHLARRSRRG